MTLTECQIYFAGESYAGQHIPYIAAAIIKRNAKFDDKSKRWKLKGLLIGNGWISPTDQYPSYLKFAYEENLLTKGSDSAKRVEEKQAACTAKLSKGGAEHVDTSECEEILQDILRESLDDKAPIMDRCYNMYDVRLHDSYSSCGMNWPPDLEKVTPYLRRADVRRALNVDKQKQAAWTECNGAVGSAFTPHAAPSITLLPDILTSVPIVLFSGNKDLICNHIGTESLIHNLAFNNGTGFETTPGVWAPRQSWTFEGEPAGFYQSARNLTYVLFYNSSHMVPFDYPRRTRDMLDRFMGVDIGSIGGKPGDSRIDGAKAGLETSVGGHPDSSAAVQENADKVKQAESHAYYKSGEAVLLVVVLAAAGWGWWVWRGRRRRGRLGYAGVRSGDGGDDAPGVLESMREVVMEPHRRGKKGGRDLEAADFDEKELDDLTPARRRVDGDGDRDAGFDLGSEDESEGEDGSVGGKGERDRMVLGGNGHV